MLERQHFYCVLECIFQEQCMKLCIFGDIRPIYYLDETWVNEHHFRKYMACEPNVPLGKGRRLMICHIGSANQGFVQLFRSKTKIEDYHNKMNPG